MTTYSLNYDSPIGNILITATETEIVSLLFEDKTVGSDGANELLMDCKNQLEEYFIGNRTTFTVPMSFDGTEFQNKVWSELLNIPFGKKISYSELSLKTGNLKAIRAVGTTNGKNKLLILCPCHRVIGKDGSLVGFAGELWRKKWLLEHEAKHSGFGSQMSMDL